MPGTAGTDGRDSRAICYSGYRKGQSPGAEIFPDEAQIGEDLAILQRNWRHLRLYDCSLHARRTLEMIRRHRLDFRVMLGAYLAAERSNPGCPWGGGTYSDTQLQHNERHNRAEIDRLIELARHYDDIVDAVAVGNECTVDWTDHLVPLERMVGYVRRVRQAVRQPVTFCENYVPWQYQLRDLAEELDFLSLHTYPVWEYRPVHEALAYTRDNVDSVARRYPGKGIVVSEAGWTTGSSGRGIPPGNVSQEIQALYYQDLMAWSRDSGMRVYVFEAFDEPWKGSPDPLEPEKHWGLFTVDRQPKLVMRSLYPDLVETVPA